MRYQTFTTEPAEQFPYAILAAKISRNDMAREYLDPIALDYEGVIAYDLHKTGKKTPASTQREYLDELMPVLEDLGSRYLIVGDGEYFKTLTGVAKTEAYLGYVMPNVYPESLRGHFNVIYVPNYRQIFHDPHRTRAKIMQGLEALDQHVLGKYRDPGNGIITFSDYPMTAAAIEVWLDKLIDMDCDLTADIEGFSLKHYDAGIGTISFAWSKHEGIAFPVDLGEDPVAVRNLLIKFFKRFTHTMTWHHISYDVCVLIYQLFMEHLIDTEGLLNGLEIMLKNWDDTKLIAYLATNTCAGNTLGLKDLSQEFTGNYAVEDIKDITKIPLPELLEYNLVDSMATWYVKEKYWDQMVADEQLELYTDLFKPAIWEIIQMQLTGMPLDMDRVAEAKAVFEEDRADAIRQIQSHKLVKEFTYILDEEHVATRNEELKKKQIKLGDEPQEFNPNSSPQKQRLLYELIGLPIIEQTKSKQPATGADVLAKLKAHTDDQSVKDLLNAFLEFSAVDKLYGTFIPAMEAAVQGPDGCYYLFGSFNLGGTLSARLSSSDPNLQTIPSKMNKHGKRDYSKLIKLCFVAPEGWIMVGLDFDSLEDKISGLTTRDPNKLKVYIDGYDGHSLRAHSYFGENMPDIETAPDGAKCFKATIGGQPVWFHANEEVTYLGQTLSGQELWDRLGNVQVAAA